jgi:DNA-binding GntR family transcriptional regulator
MVDVAFRYVRDAIMSGELEPGSRVGQDAIAKQLGISRMPLREALRRLEELGFVTIRPHRGAFVTEPDITEIRSTYAVRTLLESASAAQAAANMDEERIERLREILRDARAALEAGDGASLAEHNALFHLTAHEAAGNEVLTRLISDLTMHCQRYRLLHATLSDRAAEALHEHERILEAWAAHDPEAASHWIEVNLRNSAEALVATVQESEREKAVGNGSSSAKPDKSIRW